MAPNWYNVDTSSKKKNIGMIVIDVQNFYHETYGGANEFNRDIVNLYTSLTSYKNSQFFQSNRDMKVKKMVIPHFFKSIVQNNGKRTETPVGNYNRGIDSLKKLTDSLTSIDMPSCALMNSKSPQEKLQLQKDEKNLYDDNVLKTYIREFDDMAKNNPENYIFNLFFFGQDGDFTPEIGNLLDRPNIRVYIINRNSHASYQTIPSFKYETYGTMTDQIDLIRRFEFYDRFREKLGAPRQSPINSDGEGPSSGNSSPTTYRRTCRNIDNETSWRRTPSPDQDKGKEPMKTVSPPPPTPKQPFRPKRVMEEKKKEENEVLPPPPPPQPTISELLEIQKKQSEELLQKVKELTEKLNQEEEEKKKLTEKLNQEEEEKKKLTEKINVLEKKIEQITEIVKRD